MPDPTLKTISATQSPGLFGVSPYVTRWMLYKHFADGVAFDEDVNERMDWGRRMQPLVLAQAAEDLRLEVIPNEADTYIRRGLLGCTRDATILCPDRGQGALETKCVFDYRTWMQSMNGGKTLPRPHEIQVQQQMYVGDGAVPYTWGVVAVWVAGDVYYFERAPIPELWEMLEKEAEQFFAEVEARQEPKPFGVPVELPWLTRLFATIPDKTINFVEDEKAIALAEDVRMFEWHRQQRLAHEKDEERLKGKFLALVGDAEIAEFFGGIKLNVSRRKQEAKIITADMVGKPLRKASVSASLKPYVPENLPDTLPGLRDVK